MMLFNFIANFSIGNNTHTLWNSQVNQSYQRPVLYDIKDDAFIAILFALAYPFAWGSADRASTRCEQHIAAVPQ